MVPGTVGQMFQSLRRYQDTDNVHGIVSIKEHNGNFNVQCFHTMNIENIVAPFTDVKQLNDHQKFVTATIADMKQLLLLQRVAENKKEQYPIGCCPFAYAVNQCPLRYLDGFGDFLLRLGLRHRDGQDAVLHLG